MIPRLNNLVEEGDLQEVPREKYAQFVAKFARSNSFEDLERITNASGKVVGVIYRQITHVKQAGLFQMTGLQPLYHPTHGDTPSFAFWEGRFFINPKLFPGYVYDNVVQFPK